MSGFIRTFNPEKIANDDALFKKLYEDVKNGEVFPAVRSDTLDFYYMGGVLFSFKNASFMRNRAFLKHGGEQTDKGKYATEPHFRKNCLINGTFADNYDLFKSQNKKWAEGEQAPYALTLAIRTSSNVIADLLRNLLPFGKSI